MNAKDPALEGAGRDNGITAARLGLALLVIVSHSFAMIDQLEPLVGETGGQVSLGFLAVVGFFGLSGWLLTGSRARNDVLTFARNRALRILPGYWLALLVTAGILLAVGGDPLGYIAGSWSIVRMSGPGWPDGSAANGSLWTLGPEVLCYLVLALTPARWLRPLSVGMLAMFVAIWPALPGAETQLFLAFAAGSVVRAFGIAVTTRRAVGMGLLAFALFALYATPLAIVAVASAALGLAYLPLRFSWDLSYGTYVLAYPVSKVLAEMGLGLVGVMVGTVCIVLVLATLSWNLVEAPAMRWGRRLPRSPVEQVGAGTDRPEDVAREALITT